MFDEIIENSKNEIINKVCELIKFPSISEETKNENMPFGKDCKDVLDYTLNLAKQMGFRTKNIDGYCGYIEFGEGDELVGIIGHLDVVPANLEDGWISNPFESQIRENKIFGRGAIDDKGPVVASLYAMKTILDSKVKLHKRVRLILGLNEEKNWKCINHYKEVGEEVPTIGFSPDADFPTIYAEKGILSMKLSISVSFNNVEIKQIDCKNNALNVVPKYCSITLKKLSSEKINFISTDKIIVEEIENNEIKITANGIASHAAHPDLGENAITLLLQFILKYCKNANLERLFEEGFFEITSPKFISDSKIKDESGILTSNVGFADYKDGRLIVGLNLRVPVNTKLTEIVAKYEELSNTIDNMDVSVTAKQEPLYVPKDSYLVKTLTDIFNKKTNKNCEPIAIGGGTYARAFENCIAFGANMPEDKDMCHQVNEFIKIDTLITSCKIYAEAIYELAK